MKTEIEKILFSRNKCLVADVRKMLAKGAVDVDELSAVWGEIIARGVVSESSGDVTGLPGGGAVYDGPAQSNLVILWGHPGSGRTSVIGSLLSLKGMTPILPQGADEVSRGIRSKVESLTRVFSNQDRYQQLPVMGSSLVETYHARYRKGLSSYNLSFVEACFEGWWGVDALLKSSRRQIHLFVIDCRQDIDEQVRDHQRVTDMLIRGGYLQRADGVYVLVTKADLMNAPEPYLDNAAQTLVTTSMASDFWRLIRNKCKETYIYNEQPVVCSVGDFVLKDYAKVRLDHVRNFCDDYLLPKCEHNHWGVAKVLKMGSKKMAIILSVLASLLLIIGICSFLNFLSKPPTSALQPYDFAAHFTQQVEHELSGNVDYENACGVYDRLRHDLDNEHGLHQKSGDLVLPDSEYNLCDASLCNAFSHIMESRMQQFFDGGEWSSDSAFMSQASRQLTELGKHSANMDDARASECRKYLGYLVCYRDSVKPLVNRLVGCTSLGDVHAVTEAAGRWADEYPYSHDTSLGEMLADASFKAYESYADHLVSVKDSLMSEYNSVWMWDDRARDAFGYETDALSMLKSSMATLRDKAIALRDELIDREIDSRYEDITDELEKLINKMNGILDDE